MDNNKPHYFELPTPSNKNLIHQNSKKDSRFRNPKVYVHPDSYPTYPLDAKLLFQLLRIITQGNISLCARLVAVSRPTMVKWYKQDKPSPQWYWPYVLYMVIKSHYFELKSSGRIIGKRRHTMTIIAEALGLEGHPTKLSAEFKDSMENMMLETKIEPFTQVQKWLIAHAIKHGSVDRNEFMQTHNVSLQTLRRAVKGLDMITSLPGYGKDKRAVYTLPPVWGVDPDLYVEGADDELPDMTYRKPTKKATRELMRKAIKQHKKDLKPE